MENFTALGANEITKNITFQGEMHKKFFLLYLPECRNEDVYHQALIYCLGISRDTREHVEEIYDFDENFDGILIVRKKFLEQSYSDNKKDLESLIKKVKIKKYA